MIALIIAIVDLAVGFSHNKAYVSNISGVRSKIEQELSDYGYSADGMKFVITEGEKITLSFSNSVTEDMDTEKIFEKFYRADASRKGDGAGVDYISADNWWRR